MCVRSVSVRMCECVRVCAQLDYGFVNPGPNYLSVGDQPLPSLLTGFSVCFAVALVAWWAFICRRKEQVIPLTPTQSHIIQFTRTHTPQPRVHLCCVVASPWQGAVCLQDSPSSLSLPLLCVCELVHGGLHV